jgi:hypothetical protein
VLGEKFLVDLYQVSQIWNYTPQRATYDELLSMGIANAIPDVQIRSRLANYYLGLQNSKEIQQERMPFRQNIRRYMPHFVQNFVRENCGDRFESRDDGVILISLPIECDLALGPTVVDEAVVKTLSYSDLEIDLTQSVADLENKVTRQIFTGSNGSFGAVSRHRSEPNLNAQEPTSALTGSGRSRKLG